MRPLLVLLLVLGAAGALYFALTGNSADDGGTGLAGPGVAEQAPPDAPGPQAPLVGEDRNPGERDVQPLAARPDDGARVTANEGAPSGTALLGLVVDAEGTPVPEAEVTLGMGATLDPFDATGGVNHDLDVKVETDAEGRFAFPDLDPSLNFVLFVRHPEFAPREIGNVLITEGEANEEPPIILRPGVRLKGQVLDTGGNLVSDASLTLARITGVGALADDPNALAATSDVEGRYAFENLAPGNYTLTVQADGYGRVTVPQLNVAGDADLSRDVTLEVASALAGIVTDTEGQPLEGAKVVAYSIGNRANRTQTDATTDAQGNFLIQDVPEGSYTLRTHLDAYEVASSPRVEAGDMSVQVTLQRLPTVSGRVVDAITGAPVKNFEVGLRYGVQDRNNSMLIGERTEVTDEEGRFTLSCQRHGEFIVDALAPGYAASLSETFQVGKGQDLTGVVVQLSAGGAIRGRVVDGSGRPIARAKVTTQDDRWTGSAFDLSLPAFPGLATVRSVRTNANGEFTINGLTPTTYLVEVDHKDHSKGVLRGIIVGEALETNVKDITLYQGGVVSGIVRGASGKPLSGCMVQLNQETHTDDFPVNMSVKTNAEGRYTLEHVRPGTYWIYASRPARSADNPFASANDMKNTKRKLTISDGQKLQGQDFDLGD